MTQPVGLLIQTYAREPIANYEMTDPTCSYEQGNTICGDSITVRLRIEEGSIAEYSRS